MLLYYWASGLLLTNQTWQHECCHFTSCLLPRWSRPIRIYRKALDSTLTQLNITFFPTFTIYFLYVTGVKLLEANPDVKRLYDDLLSNYNRLIRPVTNVSDILTVRLGLKLSQLMEVNLKNQVMTTNLWVEQVRVFSMVFNEVPTLSQFPNSLKTFWTNK